MLSELVCSFYLNELLVYIYLETYMDYVPSIELNSRLITLQYYSLMLS